MILKKVLITCLVASISFKAQAQIINTIAGTGVAGYSGDGGLATNAELNAATGIASDIWGNLYIADAGNNCIRKVDASGIISTVAGNGSAGYSGDGGPAINATLHFPTDVAADRNGNIYIADNYNNVVRKIDATGIISTYAGITDTAGFAGDNGPATNALLNVPDGIDVDSAGNLYISDMYNSRIRKVNSAGIITTIAGGGPSLGDGGPAVSCSFLRPSDVSVTSTGEILIADLANYRIRKINTAGIITTIAGTGAAGPLGDGGPATSATIHVANFVTSDDKGNVYISEAGTSRIRKISTLGIITTIAGNGINAYNGDGGPALLASINIPMGVATSNGHLFIADRSNQRIRKVDIGQAAIANTTGTIKNLQLYPNPNNGHFTLNGNIKGGIGPVQLSIGDVTGKIVMQEETTPVNGVIKKQVQLPGDLPAGIYLVTLTNDDGSVTLQFEKN